MNVAHPHVKLDVPMIRGTALVPILYAQAPAYDALSAKLASFINAASTLR